MKQQLILWLGAIIITFLAGYLDSVTGKYFPATGTIGIDGEKVSYKFDKIHKSNDDYRFLIRTEKQNITGYLEWKKENEQNWNSLSLKNEGANLFADIPVQESETIVDYKVTLSYEGRDYQLPGPMKILFLGEVHPIISFLFYFTLLGGLLLSTRTGLEYFNEHPKIKTYTIFTLIFFFLFTLAVNPLRLSYELGGVNKNVLPISALFEPKAVLLLSTWIIGLVLIFNLKEKKITALALAVTTLLIYVLV